MEPPMLLTQCRLNNIQQWEQLLAHHGHRDGRVVVGGQHVYPKNLNMTVGQRVGFYVVGYAWIGHGRLAAANTNRRQRIQAVHGRQI